jgi:hypothetical protein
MVQISCFLLCYLLLSRLCFPEKHLGMVIKVRGYKPRVAGDEVAISGTYETVTLFKNDVEKLGKIQIPKVYDKEFTIGKVRNTTY